MSGIFSVVKFNGSSYIVRTIKDKEGNTLLVGTEGLFSQVLHPNDWGTEYNGYNPISPKEAEEVDNQIFFYLDKETFDADEETFKKVMKEEMPEIF